MWNAFGRPAALAALVMSMSAAALPSHADPADAPAAASGVIRVKSAYSFDETIRRIKADVAAKGIRFFDDIDQGALADGAKLPLRPQHLLIFGNPPLGVQFLTSNPYAGLDWPVRMLVLQDAQGQVWIAWNDFADIKRRHAIGDRDAAFEKASEVAASIAASAQPK